MGKGYPGDSSAGTLPLQAPFLLQEKQPASQTPGHLDVGWWAGNRSEIQGLSAQWCLFTNQPRDDTGGRVVDGLCAHSIVPQVKGVWA